VTLIPTQPTRPPQTLVALDGPVEVKAGQVFTVAVTVRVTNPPGVFGAQFTLEYLPDYFEVLEVIPNPELLVAVQTVDNEQGQIAFAASRYKDVPNFTREVIFARIIFRAKPVDQPDISPLLLNDVKLGAKGGSTIPAFSQDLFLTIQQ
jgi:hypothetical protein